MAIQISTTTPEGVQLSAAYARVDYVSGGKAGGVLATVSYYKDAATAAAYDTALAGTVKAVTVIPQTSNTPFQSMTRQHAFPWPTAGQDVLAYVYTQLLALPEFSGGVSV